MSNKFRSSGYHPIQKLNVILAGLHVAVVTDFSVAYKVILSVPVLGSAFFFRQWVDVSLILLAMGVMLIVPCWVGQNPRLQAKALAGVCAQGRYGHDNNIDVVRTRSRVL
jgi:hypothetical protein